MLDQVVHRTAHARARRGRVHGAVGVCIGNSDARRPRAAAGLRPTPICHAAPPSPMQMHMTTPRIPHVANWAGITWRDRPLARPRMHDPTRGRAGGRATIAS